MSKNNKIGLSIIKIFLIWFIANCIIAFVAPYLLNTTDGLSELQQGLFYFIFLATLPSLIALLFFNHTYKNLTINISIKSYLRKVILGINLIYLLFSFPLMLHSIVFLFMFYSLTTFSGMTALELVTINPKK